ncbi:hypothetical protein ACFQVD_33965 [Streptosporangium amethystogenes subsp. fukuiense]|uniref:DUF1648 domain-containing protein n=1 Tax=Streptosporangium amethystogenes subsp. fukuiense TaxID=698418 RepID=A0ABW2TAN4_9ACTN
MIIVVLTPLSVFVLTLAVPFLLSERLPDPVAAHFTDGHPDESAPLQPLIRDILILGASVWAILALLAYLRPAGSLGRRAAAGSAAALPTALGLAVLLGTVGANLDAPTWREATTSPTAEVITIAGGALVFVFGAIAVHPSRRGPREAADLPTDPVVGRARSRRGRTLWIGQSRNPDLVWKTFTATCIMVALTIAGTRWMAVPALLSLATLHLWGGIVASFDGTTLSVRGRIPFGLLRRIPLSRIETAERIEIDPQEWGWGWRLRSIRRHAIVIRKGEGLLVALRGGGEFIVTVDDAAGGAEEIRRALRGQPPSRPATVRGITTRYLSGRTGELQEEQRPQRLWPSARLRATAHDLSCDA